MSRRYNLNGQALESWLFNYYLEMWAGLPNRKQSSWDFCPVHSPSAWIDLAFRKATLPATKSSGLGTGCFGTEEETG